MLESCLDARIALDFHPPQGAHTRYLRTLSKNLSSAGASPPPQLATFRRQRAAHHTTIFLTVNTPRCPFLPASPPSERRTPEGRAHDFRLAGRRGARILTVVALQGKRKSTNRSKNSCRTGKLTGSRPGTPAPRTRAGTRRSLIGGCFYRSRQLRAALALVSGPNRSRRRLVRARPHRVRNPALHAGRARTAGRNDTEPARPSTRRQERLQSGRKLASLPPSPFWRPFAGYQLIIAIGACGDVTGRNRADI